MAYERVAGPLGPERDDILTALLATVVHNVFAKKGKKVKDFLPEWDRKPQTPEDMLHTLRHLNRIYGGEEN